MDSDYLVDIESVKKNIEKAECIVFYFPIIEKTLVLDTRFSSVEGPMVRVMPRVGSVEERFKILRKLRPRFPAPETITFVPWPKYVASLKKLGVWQKVMMRLQASGYVDPLKSGEIAFRQLRLLEREEMAKAIKGVQYTSLWERKRKR